jgi:hypothetical protein
MPQAEATGDRVSPEFWGRFALCRAVLWVCVGIAGSLHLLDPSSVVVLFWVSIVTAAIGEIAIWQASKAEREAKK